MRTVALLAREAGLRVLRDGLLGNPLVELLAVFTHGHLPKAEGAGPRPEVADFRAVCEEWGVALRTLDLPEARRVEDHLPEGEIDLMVVLSWRCAVAGEALDRLAVGGLNLHRGDLPRYAGAEPVRRALEAGEPRVAITAHRLGEEIDTGPALAKVWLDIGGRPVSLDAAGHAEVVKRDLLPLYAPLARLAVAAMAAEASR